MPAVASVRGTVTLTDGATAEFLITAETWSQWGHSDSRRAGDFVDALDGLRRGLEEDGLFDDDPDEDEDDEDEDELDEDELDEHDTTDTDLED